ncbi:hypothetical protein C8R44DRAFT_776745, partial [Mycena epipterygia]
MGVARVAPDDDAGRVRKLRRTETGLSPPRREGALLSMEQDTALRSALDVFGGFQSQSQSQSQGHSLSQAYLQQSQGHSQQSQSQGYSQQSQGYSQSTSQDTDEEEFIATPLRHAQRLPAVDRRRRLAPARAHGAHLRAVLHVPRQNPGARVPRTRARRERERQQLACAPRAHGRDAATAPLADAATRHAPLDALVPAFGGAILQRARAQSAVAAAAAVPAAEAHRARVAGACAEEAWAGGPAASGQPHGHYQLV